MNKARRPNSLRNHSFVTLLRDRADDSLTMYTEDGQSFEMGSYWEAHNDAIPYLTRALGNPEMSEGLVTTAYNFGVSLGDITLQTVVSVDMTDPEETYRSILQMQFGHLFNDFFDERPADEAVHIDSITDRGE
jgi:hypothetical protein